MHSASQRNRTSRRRTKWQAAHERTHPGLEPVDKFDNVLVVHCLEHFELVKDHLLMALDLRLEDDLDCHLALRMVCLADDAECAGAECLSESVESLLVIARRLTVNHFGNYVCTSRVNE